MNTPILYVGAPGVGKTATIRANYDHCEVLLLSSQTEEDIAGLPYRDGEDEKRTVPPFIRRLQQATGTKCLFLDEIDKARREVADTLLTLVTHPGSFGIPEGTDIIAAANPPEWGGGDGISLPMQNRFSIVKFTPDITKWSTYIKNKYGETDFIIDLIKSITNQELPFLESTGEGLEWRLTSPRSIDAAISVCFSGTENFEEVVKGLVTPNFASGILRLHRKHAGSISDKVLGEVQDFSRIIGARAVALNKQVLRR